MAPALIARIGATWCGHSAGGFCLDTLQLFKELEQRGADAALWHCNEDGVCTSVETTAMLKQLYGSLKVKFDVRIARPVLQPEDLGHWDLLRGDDIISYEVGTRFAYIDKVVASRETVVKFQQPQFKVDFKPFFEAARTPMPEHRCDRNSPSCCFALVPRLGQWCLDHGCVMLQLTCDKWCRSMMHSCAHVWCAFAFILLRNNMHLLEPARN